MEARSGGKIEREIEREIPITENYRRSNDETDSHRLSNSPETRCPDVQLLVSDRERLSCSHFR